MGSKYKCKVCSEDFETLHRYRTLHQIHNKTKGKVLVPCPFPTCKVVYMYISYPYLLKHVRSHFQQSPVSSSEIVEKKYLCYCKEDNCEQRYNYSDYISHIKRVLLK